MALFGWLVLFAGVGLLLFLFYRFALWIDRCERDEVNRLIELERQRMVDDFLVQQQQFPPRW